MNHNLVGTTIRNRYYLVKEIEEIRTGVTFIAKDRECSDKLCIVKQFKPQLSNLTALESARNLFNTEVAILNQIGKHNGISHLLDYFAEKQSFFTVYELIKGKKVSRKIADRQYFTQSYLISFLENILETLVFIQQQGIIHRDIKPANLIIRSGDRKIVLINFSFATKITTQNKQQDIDSQPKMIIGTKNYIPVEQVMGNPGLYSDLHALGIVAVQALTGKLPQDLNSDRHGELIWHHHLPNKKQYHSQLLKIIDKAIRYDYHKRYQSAKDFLQDIKRFKSSNLTKHQVSYIFRQKLYFLKNKTVKIALIFILAFTTFISWQFLRQISPINYIVYKNQDYKIKIKYPDTWQIQKRDDFLMSGVIFVSPLESDRDLFRENISILVENLVTNISLNEYTAKSIVEIKKFSDPNINQTKQTVLGSYPAQSVVYQGKEDNLPVKRMQVWTIFKNKVYIITYTAQPDRYETYLPIVKKMIASFDLILQVKL